MTRIVFVCILLLAAATSSFAADDVLSLSVKPAEGTVFEFGKLADVRLTVRNASKRAVVVEQIVPVGDAEFTAHLTGGAYGEVTKLPDAEAYRFNGLRQMMTRLGFYSGMLLPGESVTVVFGYRAVDVRATFEVSYVAAEQDYDGTPKSLLPLKPYIPVEQDRKVALTRDYIPFTEARWKVVSAKQTSTYSAGAGASPRAVLLPDLDAKVKRATFPVALTYVGAPFTREKAAEVAGKIAGRRADGMKLAWCSAFGGYVVFGPRGGWVLSTPGQTGKGELLTPIPPVLLKDVDGQDVVRVRVGDKQVGFGSDVMTSTRTFWGRYAVYFGDGMYTRGEFLHLKRADVLEFLRLALEKGKSLKAHGYYFNSRYYTPADLMETVVGVRISVPTGAWRAFEPDGRARGGHQSGDPERPRIYLERTTISANDIAALWSRAEAIPEALRHTTAAPRPEWTRYVEVTITYAKGDPSRFVWSLPGEHADPQVRALAKRLLMHRVGAW